MAVEGTVGYWKTVLSISTKRSGTVVNNNELQSEFLGEIILSSTGILILGIMWILASPLWFLAENTAMGIIWLCVGIIELIIALIRRNNREERRVNF